MAFPNHGGRTPGRADVYRQVEQVHLLRDRIAHHEPIFRRDLQADFTTMIEVASLICPDSAAWVHGLRRVPKVLAGQSAN